MALDTTPSGASADAFVSLEDFKAYHEARGNDLCDSTVADIEQAIRRGTAYLSDGFIWRGTPTNGRDQALEWPRSGVCDKYNNALPDDELPRELIAATCEAAYQELIMPGVFATMASDGAEVFKSEAYGDVKFERFTRDEAPGDAGVARSVEKRILDLIGPFRAIGAGQVPLLRG